MMRNISMSAADDIIHIGDDVNIHPDYLSLATIILGNLLNWLEKTIVSDHIFCISGKLIGELTHDH